MQLKMSRWKHPAIWLLILFAAGGCTGPKASVVKPDWENPAHSRVAAQVVPLLISAGKSPAKCGIFFLDSKELNAVSLGNCRFGFTMGLVNTGDVELIRGVAAHEVAHELLGHADKRQAAVATEQAIRTAVSFLPGVGGLIASGAVLIAGTIALPAYSRSQESEADQKAVVLLREAYHENSAKTMAYGFRVLIERHGATGGGLLDSHPHMQERLQAMEALVKEGK